MKMKFLSMGSLPHRFLPALAVGLGLTLFGAFLHQGSNLAAKLLGRQIPFQPGIVDYATARVSNLGTGVFFISLGRPRGICDLFVGNHRIATNRGIMPQLRGKLLLGAAFRNTAGDVNIEVRCEREPGVQTADFSHTPVLSSYGVGLFLHGWRTFSETMFGPFASLFLLFAVLLAPRSRSRLTHVRHRWAYLAFSVVGLVYTLTLAEFPRLFFPPSTTTWLAAAMTVLFSLGLYILCGFHSRLRMGVVDAHGVLFVALAVWAGLAPESFASWSRWTVALLALGTATSLWDFSRAKLESEAGLFFRYLASAWLFAQAIQLVGMTANVGLSFLAGTAMVIVALTAIAYRRHVARLARLEATIVQVLRVVQTPLAPSAKLAEIASLTSAATHFQRASAYIDAFVLGLRDKKLETFVRVMERGYRKETSRDRYIEFSEDRGGVMRKALNLGVPTLEKGQRDGAWYVNIPVGAGGCINLSDVRPKPDYVAYESFAILQRLLPSMAPLAEMLVPPSAQNDDGLDKVRELRGLGTHDVDMASIFVDVDDYDANHVRFKDPYGLFVESIYFPALVRRVRPLAVREWTNRDELHLVTLAELLEAGRDIAGAVQLLVTEIFRFAEGEGAALCQAHGYDPVSLHLGASWGRGRLICATDFVRIDGEPVQRSVTLQQAAERGSALVDASLVNRWPKSETELEWEKVPPEVTQVTSLEAYRSRRDRPVEPRRAA
jgi:hypothetical protein